MAETPTIGAGETEVQIDTFNQWMRAQPFYQQLLRSWGQDPGHPHNLSATQKTQIVRAAQAVGAQIDEAHMEVDDNGNFQNQGHKLRNTLIVAGIAGAALLTMGAAGVFAGAGAAGSAGASATGGTLAATSTVPAIGALAGGTASGAVPAALAAGTAGGAAAGGAATGGAAAGLGATAARTAATSGNLAGDVLRYGVPVAGSVIGSLIQAHAQGTATDAQQKYLEEALAYEKSRDAAAIALEANRYSNYSANVAPYLATGASANTRMAGLLGLPASSAAADVSKPAAPGGSPTAPISPIVRPPGVSGPGPSDMHLMSDTPAPTAAGPPAASPGQMILMRAPDGSTRSVPANQLQHWLSVGATQVGGPA